MLQGVAQVPFYLATKSRCWLGTSMSWLGSDMATHARHWSTLVLTMLSSLDSVTHPLTLKWFRGFISRWPALKVNKRRSLEMSRARCASVAKVDNYFSKLKVIIEKCGFDKEPQLIYNVGEKGFSQCHSPPSVVCSGDAQPPAVTAGKSSTITVIGCGNATGAAVPPFIIFPGKRMLPKLLDGATPGTTGRMSDSGWSNSELFRDYPENHFLKHVLINVDQKVLLLLDGHKSHASVGLSQWAMERDHHLRSPGSHKPHYSTFRCRLPWTTAKDIQQ